MKKRKEQIFAYIWIYILVLILVIFVWTAIFSSLNNVKDNQRLVVSVYNLDYDTQVLKEEIAACLSELTEQEILEVYVDDWELAAGDTYTKTFLTVQLLQTDLIIMPESLLEELEVDYYFPELPQTLISDTNEQYYQANGKNYGILISDGSRQNHFSQYCHTKERCYLLLSATSYNLGAIFKRGEPGNDAALALVKYLLESEEN